MQNQSHAFTMVFQCLITLTTESKQCLFEQLNCSFISLFWIALYSCLYATRARFLILLMIVTDFFKLISIKGRKESRWTNITDSLALLRKQRPKSNAQLLKLFSLNVILSAEVLPSLTLSLSPKPGERLEHCHIWNNNSTYWHTAALTY